MNRSVFLDRDGVINNDEGLYYIHRPIDFKINDGVLESIALLHENGFLVIVISNQGGIAKGMYTRSDTDLLHNILIKKVEEAGGKITEIYYCPHHQDMGLCLCRKPQSLMLEKAIARFNISVADSYFIGDGKRDMEAAEKVGIKGILIEKNSNIYSICQKIISGTL